MDSFGLDQTAEDWGIDQHGSSGMFLEEFGEREEDLRREESAKNAEKKREKERELREERQRKNSAKVDEDGILRLRSSLDFVQMLVRSNDRELNTLIGIGMDLINRESHQSRIPGGVIDEMMKKRCAQFETFGILCDRFHEETDTTEDGEEYGSELLEEIVRTSRDIYMDTHNIRICIVFCLVAECEAMQRLVRLGKFVSLRTFRCDLRYHSIPKASFEEYMHMTKILRTVFLNGQMAANLFIQCLCATTPCGVHAWITQVVKPARVAEAQRLAQDIDKELQNRILLESEESSEDRDNDFQDGIMSEWD